jgi:putative membrane protein
MKLRFCFAVSALALCAMPALADSPQQFIHKAMQGDNSEVMLGRMAERNAVTPVVRNFGHMLAVDHSMAREQAVRVAMRLGVRPTSDPAPEAMQEHNRLAGMRGRRAFDREFVRYMINDHRKDIADFREEANEDHGPASQMAQRQLPTLRKHLDMAMSLDRNSNYGNAGYRRR